MARIAQAQQHSPPHARVVLVLVAAFLVAAPNVALVPANSFDVQRVLQIGLFATLALALTVLEGCRTATSRAIQHVPIAVRIGVGAAICLGLISSLLAPIPTVGIREVALWTGLLGLSAVVAGSILTGSQLVERGVLTALSWGAALYVVSFFGLHAAFSNAGLTAEGFEPFLTVVGFDHPRFLNHYLILTLPLVAVPLVRGSDLTNRMTKPAAWIALIGSWFLMYVAGGRGATLGLLIALVVVIFVDRAATLPWLRVQGIGLAAGTAIYASVVLISSPTSTPVQAALDRGTTDEGRFALWSHAWDLWQGSPFLGIGPGHYALYPVPALGAAPHSVPIQLATEWGSIAALLLIATAVWAGFGWLALHRDSAKAAQSASKSTAPLTMALTVAFVATAVDGLFAGVTNLPTSGTLIFLVIGLGYGLVIRGRSTDVPGRWGQWPVSIAALTATIALIATAVAHPPPATPTSRGEGEAEAILLPRFWLDGRLD
jgi:putative inorganic carbon (hco3(-)) transporter